MYQKFFGMRDKPFSLLPDPAFLFLSKKHSTALSMLEYSLAGHAGFCAITGEIGSGKTTLIRALLRRIGRDITLGLISNTHASQKNIATWALAAFGQQAPGGSESDVYRELMQYLINEYAAGRRCVLVVDEAQNLTIESLEELRLLSNINSDSDLLLQIILVGQPELLEKLKRPELRQFAQRISISYHLKALSFEETKMYISHRLNVAGASGALFSDMAIGGVQYFSGGVPRVINSICDMALVYCFADEKRVVDLDIVLRVISDRQASGLASFAGVGQPKDPDVVSGISGMVQKAAALAEATGANLPGAGAAQVDPVMPHTASFDRAETASDSAPLEAGGAWSAALGVAGEKGAPARIRNFQDHRLEKMRATDVRQRPSWFRRTFGGAG
ncbi:MAG: AAA family ATPase [Rhodospirillaceae bacterium]|nr:AAA family ATPase [Rhodospirillaceae bacterium]